MRETNTTMPKQTIAAAAVDALAVETRKVLLIEHADAKAGEVVYSNGMTFWTDPDGRVWEIDCSMRMRVHEPAS